MRKVAFYNYEENLPMPLYLYDDDENEEDYYDDDEDDAIRYRREMDIITSDWYN